ncbi:unnamed protein product [Staurois parvus]|uniref:NF-kappa-B inhibitor-interacting Ras-like protein 2 n=1 Tax=Staurois parvus TaxID=386267 RepID=A0ABN9GKE0_9NEOB|nr:unnamed protein product [Staurois parvus]
MGKGSRVVICGLATVGKTAILEQVIYGNHIVGQEHSDTLEDVYVASVETERGVREQLRIYDTHKDFRMEWSCQNITFPLLMDSFSSTVWTAWNLSEGLSSLKGMLTDSEIKRRFV